MSVIFFPGGGNLGVCCSFGVLLAGEATFVLGGPFVCCCLGGGKGGVSFRGGSTVGSQGHAFGKEPQRMRFESRSQGAFHLFRCGNGCGSNKPARTSGTKMGTCDSPKDNPLQGCGHPFCDVEGLLDEKNVHLHEATVQFSTTQASN